MKYIDKIRKITKSGLKNRKQYLNNTVFSQLEKDIFKGVERSAKNGFDSYTFRYPYGLSNDDVSYVSPLITQHISSLGFTVENEIPGISLVVKW